MRHPYRLLAFGLLCITVIGLGAAPAFDPNVSPFTLPVGTVILDAGHGGHDPGATATHEMGQPMTIREKDIVLDVMLKVSAILRERYPQVHVITSRTDDRFISLQERSALAATANPGVGRSSIFISIHANSTIGNGASGMELLIKQTDKQVRFLDSQVPDWVMSRYANHTSGELNRLLNRENLLLASYMQESLVSHFPDVRFRGIKEQDVWVLNASKVPSILVEIGFVSNHEEALLMQDDSWRASIAEAIVQGLANYINRD